MKKILSLLFLAALTVGLLGSCAKIDERISNLEKRIDGIESEQIASIKSQVDAINTSIADLGTIRQNVQTLMNTTPSKENIEELRKADEALGRRIDELKSYTDGELTKYATIEWVKATFATLEQHQWTCDTIAKIDARIGALDAKLSQSISGLESSLKQWVNEQLDAYYTAAQMDAKLDVMRNDINNAKVQGKTATDKADSLATELTTLKAAVDTAKANIRNEYKAAIQSAIETSEGKLSQALKDSIAEVNNKISALDTRVTTLESKVLALEGKVDKLLAMIQSVSITPAYSDGSVEAVNGILTLKCIVSPAEALTGMESLKDSLLLYADSVKVKTKATTPAYMTIEVSEASVLDTAQGAITLTADISEYLPKGEDKALTVAVNIKNGISDFTTEFVPVYVDPRTFKAVYNTNDGANTLTFYYDNSLHVGEGVLYDNLPFAATTAADWGYNGVRSKIENVVINESVENYKGLTSTAYMFQGMTAASDISGAEYLDVSNVTDMSLMFMNFGGGSTNSHTTLNSVPDVSNWNTANVTNMTGMFWDYGNFSDNLTKVPDVCNWNTANVTNMAGMFQQYGYSSINFNDVPDVSGWSTVSVEDMSTMFRYYGKNSTALTAVPDVCNWNTAEVKTMAEMFREYGASSTVLKAVPDVSNWETGNVTSVVNLFQNYGKGSVDFVLDLSGWDLSKITSNKGDKVFDFTPNTFKVTIPAKTGEKSNEGGKWYYGDGTNSIAPPAGKTFTILPAGALKGVFSVSATKKVYFSKGNLYYNGSKFDFEANQYEYHGYDSANNTWGLFGWVGASTTSNSSPEIYGVSTSTEYLKYGNVAGEALKADWGTAIDDKGTWSTLSTAEWQYLFNNHSKKWATVNGVNGYVIAPDGFAGTLSDTYADDAALAANNLVFLPAAGSRNGSGVSEVNEFGYYWSSSAYNDRNAYFVGFLNSNVSPNAPGFRSYGFSVRLVTEVSAAGSTIEDFNKKNDDPGNWN